MRKFGRTDTNQQRIIDALRRAGCTVRDTSSIGRGFPDICVGWRNRNTLLEIKRGPNEKLTLDQQTFEASWAGQWARVSNEIEALEVVGVL